MFNHVCVKDDTQVFVLRGSDATCLICLYVISIVSFWKETNVLFNQIHDSQQLSFKKSEHFS